MSDIVERLRLYAVAPGSYHTEAADEIERLRASVSEAFWVISIALPNKRLTDSEQIEQMWRNRRIAWLADNITVYLPPTPTGR